MEEERSSRGSSTSLDALLSDAAAGGLQQWSPGLAGVKAVAKLAARPTTVASRSWRLTKESVRIAAGRSDVAPHRRDTRFADDAWQGNPVLRRAMQNYLVSAELLERLLDDANLDWRSDRRLRFLVTNVTAALAPSNVPLLNPAALKAGLDTGGGNYLAGLRQLAKDMVHAPRIPQMVDTDAFTVGEDLALTEGAVVLRTPVFELIQYRPTTPRVREVPVLLVPPMINKFYIADIAPGRSMIEHFVGAGLQMFAVSWRNPDADAREWDLDTYAGAVLEAMDAVEAVTGCTRAQVMGLCAGGIVTSTVASHLAATGRQERLAGLTLAVTVLDQAEAGTVGSLVDEPTAAMAAAESSRTGYLDGRALAGVFAWLRPDDLVWRYWVNNYLLAKKPPAFDVLYWNADTTRMPAGLHHDFLRLAVDNSLVRPGAAEVLGTPVDLSAVTVDTYSVAGVNDHICPWENVYRSGLLLGSTPRFALSTSGHIAALVNPPGSKKASFQVSGENPEDPQEWLSGAATHQGSWWTDWEEWVTTRAGDERDAPADLGGPDHAPLDAAPGTYVLQD